MNALKKTMLASVCGICCVVVNQAHALLTVTNFTHDLSTKTGWTAVQGGDAGYVAGLDFTAQEIGHSSVTNGTSERQAFMDSLVNVAEVEGLTLSFRVMLHNTIAGVNEAVARMGLLDSGAAPAAGQLYNAWITLRRVGSIELQVQRRTDGVGGVESVLSTSGAMPSGDTTGIGGYNYADFTVVRNPTGMWSVSVTNAYGNNVLNFTGQESTVATSSSLDKVWMQDLSGQWNGSETAVYWDSVLVTSTIPEPTSMALLGLGGIYAVWMRRRKV